MYQPMMLSYVEPGDLKLDRRFSHQGCFEMPMAHYRGATISFEIEIARKALTVEIKDFPVVDKIDGIEPPLAYMIPEGSDHIVLPIATID